MNARFDGKVAIVTGASRGIGFAIAERIVSEGGRVCITGRQEAALQDAVSRIGASEKCVYAVGEADDVAHQTQAVDKVVEAFGPINVLVNNVGVNPAFGSLLDASRGGMRRMVDVNVIAAIDWVARCRDRGLGDGGGSVVNVASAAGLRPALNIGFYGATKAALMYVTQQLAAEMSPDVRINAVAPAVVRTKFAGPLYSGQEDEVAARYPMSRLGEPADVADAVAFLSSDQASWITGQVVVIDGGLTLGGGI